MIQRISIIFFLITILGCMNSTVSQAETSAGADSIRVKWMDGKKFILHKIEPKETWISLTKRYNCDLDELKSFNKGVEDLKIGQIINIPVSVKSEPTSISEPKVVTTKPKDNPVAPVKVVTTTPATQTPVMYTVKQGETLYSIAKRFEQKVEDIKQYNNLSSDALHNGQKLIVRYISKNDNSKQVNAVQPVSGKPENVTEKVNPPSENSFSEKATKSVSPVKKANGGKTLMQVTETGIASWIQDGQVNQDKYYGLHRTAPIGTIMKVTNRMNNQFVYVKIVGVLPDTGDNDNVIIKVSQAVSNKLNALDAHYQVEVSYGLMQ